MSTEKDPPVLPSNVVVMNGPTRLPIPVERVLDGHKDLEAVLVLGFDKSGNFTAATSTADLYACADMCQRFLHKLYRGDYDGGFSPSRR